MNEDHDVTDDVLGDDTQDATVDDNSDTSVDVTLGDESDTTDDSATDDSSTDDSSTDDQADDSTDEGATDDYVDFTLPEGFNMNEALLEQVTPIFKEDGLTQEQAQKYIDLYADGMQALQQSQTDAFSQLKTQWRDDSRSDDEFGGDDFDKNIGIANQALTEFGTPELKTLLRDYGLGNHPEVIRSFYRMGVLLQEDNPGSSNASTSKKDRVSTLYPSG